MSNFFLNLNALSGSILVTLCIILLYKLISLSNALSISNLFLSSNLKYLNFSIINLLKALTSPCHWGWETPLLIILIPFFLQKFLIIFAMNSPPLSVWKISSLPIVSIKSLNLYKIISAVLLFKIYPLPFLLKWSLKFRRYLFCKSINSILLEKYAISAGTLYKG